MKNPQTDPILLHIIKGNISFSYRHPLSIVKFIFYFLSIEKRT
jgi:hypothetical protein